MVRITPMGLLRLVAALALAASLVLPARGLYGVDLCLFHRTTGLPCPGCGMTRAFCAIGHGQFVRAWALHPFAFPFYGMALGLVSAPLLVRWIPALDRQEGQRILGYLGMGLLMAMGLFGLVRMARFYPWP